MPKFTTSAPHTLGRDKAKEQLRAYFAKAKEFPNSPVKDVTEDYSKWDDESKLGFSVKTMGITIKGIMTVTENAVNIDGEIPFAAVMFKGKIESGFKDMVGKALV